MRYILGDGTGSRYLYIQFRPASYEDMTQLAAALDAHESYQKTGELTFNGQSFLAFIDAAQNVSGCMTLFDGQLLAFIFHPQDDSEYMLLAAEIMNTFRDARSE